MGNLFSHNRDTAPVIEPSTVKETTYPDPIIAKPNTKISKFIKVKSCSFFAKANIPIDTYNNRYPMECVQ